jgi:hypothetical protein
VRRATAEGYRIGKTAAWLSGADWEALLPMPLDTVRRVLQLPPPTIYHRALEMNRRYFGVQRGYAMADSAAAPL